METNDILSSDLLKFVLVTLMSLVIGLSQRKLYLKEEDSKHAFGADRTLTLIGILGYILYVAGSGSIVPFLCGGVTLTLLFVAYYIHKIRSPTASPPS